MKKIIKVLSAVAVISALVLTVACERDLTSGIKDCYPLPVIGILNDRPFGPCFNTTVDVRKIDEALSQILLIQEPAAADA